MNHINSTGILPVCVLCLAGRSPLFICYPPGGQGGWILMTVIGQIPALFNMEWCLPNYAQYDLSSLRFAIYGGQAVPREFLVKMKAMAPRIGTGPGLMETAGFCTYTNVDADVDELAQGIGYDSPLCPP
jgi:fatty-acyl-CoA synthase